MRTLPLELDHRAASRAPSATSPPPQGKEVELEIDRRRDPARPGDPRRDLGADRPPAAQRGRPRDRDARASASAAGKPRRGRDRAARRAARRPGRDRGRRRRPRRRRRSCWRGPSEVGSLADVLAAAGVSTAAEVDRGGRPRRRARRGEEPRRGARRQPRDAAASRARAPTVMLLLPLTLALLRVLLLRARRAALRRADARACARWSRSARRHRSAGRPSIELRGEAVPLADLPALGRRSRAAPARAAPAARSSSPRAPAVAVACDRGPRRPGGRRQEPRPAARRASPATSARRSSATARVALILDPDRLLGRRRRRGRAAARAATRASAAAPKVLVVDDQFTRARAAAQHPRGGRLPGRDGARRPRGARRRSPASPTIDLVLTDVADAGDGRPRAAAGDPRGRRASRRCRSSIVTSQRRRRGPARGAPRPAPTPTSSRTSSTSGRCWRRSSGWSAR